MAGAHLRIAKDVFVEEAAELRIACRDHAIADDFRRFGGGAIRCFLAGLSRKLKRPDGFFEIHSSSDLSFCAPRSIMPQQFQWHFSAASTRGLRQPCEAAHSHVNSTLPRSH